MPRKQLKKPVLDKVSGSNEKDDEAFSYGFSSMQGWRKQMEDAHCVEHDASLGMTFFGVFDGHGGPGAARFCAQALGGKVLERMREYMDTSSSPAAADQFRAGRSQVISHMDKAKKIRPLSTIVVSDVMTCSRSQPRARAATTHGGVASTPTEPVDMHEDSPVCQSTSSSTIAPPTPDFKNAMSGAFTDLDKEMQRHHSIYVSNADEFGDPGTTAVTVLVRDVGAVSSVIGKIAWGSRANVHMD